MQNYAINLRTLERLRYDYSLGDSLVVTRNGTYQVKEIDSIALLEILERLLGSSSDLAEALAKLASEKHPDFLTQSYSKEFLSIFIALADYPHNGFRVSDTKYIYNGKIHYSISNPMMKGWADPLYTHIEITPSDAFEILNEAYLNYRKYFNVKKNLGSV